MSVTTDTFARFMDVVASTLDEPETSGEALAARVHLSRFHFDRLVSATAGEPPATLRRRILLERAAYRLLTIDHDVLPIALDADYSSHEASHGPSGARTERRRRSGAASRPGSRSSPEPGALQPTRGSPSAPSRKGDRHGAPHPHG